MKTHCSKGHEYTPENTGYRKNGRNPKLLVRACKECQKIRCREYVAKNPDSRKNRVSANKEMMREKKSQLVEYKGGICYDCKKVYPMCVFHFDHRNPEEKEAGIAQLMHRPIEEIKLEVNKCDMVCANCHAVRTYGNESVGRKISAAKLGKWSIKHDALS